MVMVETVMPELTPPDFGNHAREAVAKEDSEVSREQVLEETRAFIAHELRNALLPIDILNEMQRKALAEGKLDERKTAEFTEIISKQSSRMHRLVNRYLEYAQRFTPKLEQVNINQFLNNRLDSFRAEFDRRGIILTPPEGPGTQVRIDRRLMAEALEEVWLNAMDAMEQGGRLTVHTQREQGRVIVTISDTGRGVKPDHLGRLFELGFTTRLGRTVAGVGLALARRIIHEAHGGRISIANNPDGAGATVTILLPATAVGEANGNQDSAVAHRR
jgi:two-component system sensor histidine kinase HydH